MTKVKFPKCEECRNRFDGKDQRATVQDDIIMCPLCTLYTRDSSPRWAYGNSCQWLFADETFITKEEAQAAATSAFGDQPDTRVFPVVTTEIPRDFAEDPGNPEWARLQP